MRQLLETATRAIARAIRTAIAETDDWVRAHWQVEVPIVIASAIVGYSTAPFAEPSDLSRLLQAGISLFVGFALPAALVFLGTLLWYPIADHRRLVAERNQVRDDYDRFRRTLNMQAQANDWSLHTGNAIRNFISIRDVGHDHDMNQECERVEEFMDRVKAELVRLGQPTLAAELPEFGRRPEHIEGLLDFVHSVHPLFLKWRQWEDFPPFENAPAEGLRKPMIWRP